jgi:Golgi nucleoside diphosphatase
MVGDIKEIWVVRRALSRGVYRRDVNGTFTTAPDYVFSYADHEVHMLGRDCAATEAEAVVLAEAMRVAKIASLKKQIAKLEKLRFGSAP